MAQAVADWGAQRGGTLGNLAVNAGATLNAAMEAVGINGAASTGDAIANGRTGEALLGTAFLAIPGGEGASGAVRTEAKNLAEHLTMQEAMSGAGREIMQGKVKDARYPAAAWAKMSHTHTTPGGTTIEIHYWKNRLTDALEGFKFKNP